MTNEDDIRIGGNLRRIRKSLGVSQEKLGDMLGITFQQVQKYENATNRISMSTGLKICRGLGIQITDLTGTIETVPGLQVLDKISTLEAKIKAARDALA